MNSEQMHCPQPNTGPELTTYYLTCSLMLMFFLAHTNILLLHSYMPVPKSFKTQLKKLKDRVIFHTNISSMVKNSKFTPLLQVTMYCFII